MNLHTYNDKTNTIMENTFNPKLQGFFNTIEYKNPGKLFPQPQAKIKCRQDNFQDEEKDPKTKKLEILLNAKSTAQKNFEKKVRNHLRSERRNFLSNSNNKVLILFKFI